MLLLHGLERTHTTVALELTTVVDDGVTRALLCTGYERADHYTATTGSQSLDDITRVTEAAIGDEGHTRTLQGTIHIIDST